MPRRRPSRKSQTHLKPRPVDRRDGQLKRWNTSADIELDDEDQFHASRDEIMLDEREVDEESDEEEVFALQGASSDDDEAEYPHESESDGMQVDSDAEPEPIPSKSKSEPLKTKTKKAASSDSEEEEESWGRSKNAYYASNAEQLDSEDEEANALEEQEALRLQAKACAALSDADFGLEDVVEDGEPPEAIEPEASSEPALTKAPQDKQSIIRTLEKKSPETLALARDWEDTVYNLVEAKARVEALDESESDALELGLQHIYYQALLTYATTLAFYLHLRATDKYAARPELLRRHPILMRLLTLKQGINTLETLGVGQDVSDNDADGKNEEEDEEDELTDQDAEDGDLWSVIKKKGLESGELADLLQDAASPTSPQTRASTKKEHAEKRPRKKAKAAASQAFDLLEPEYTRTPSQKAKVVPVVDTVAATDPYGEVTALDYHDLSDKQARKKSLRFHVSRIETASARRTNARANAVGGDDDIPYRERKKEREARLDKERQRRKERGQLGVGGDDLDDVDPEISDGGEKRKRKRGVDDDDDAGGANGYYDLVKQAAAAKKARKRAEYEAATARPELEPESSSGPRSVSRAILKNKGLTPRRSKAVRNPRVKKRQKYEQAKKKVASQKAIYKGGIGDVSKYSGEQSGISKVVKSVRL